jgi:hypothetical protein
VLFGHSYLRFAAADFLRGDVHAAHILLFIDRQRVSQEFYLDLTDDVKLVSYKDDSFLVAIDTELVVEVDDAERFLQNNVNFDLIKYLPGNTFDYKSRGDEHISIRIEPYDGKYRVHLYHSE